MKTYFFTIILLFIMFTEHHCYATGENNNEKGVELDTVRAVFYLDGKQVPYSVIREKEQKGEIGSGSGNSFSKDAIRKYGEKFRYGVYFLNSKKEEEK